MKKIINLICLICFVSLLPVVSSVAREKIPFNKVVVYPNPWIPESKKALIDNVDKKRHGFLTADGWVKFAWNRSDQHSGEFPTGTLRIYTITGELVRRINWNVKEEEDNFPKRGYYYYYNTAKSTYTYTTGQEYVDVWGDVYDTKNTDDVTYNIIHWDGKNDRYEYVESGVYIWILNIDGGRSHHGKIVVVR